MTNKELQIIKKEILHYLTDDFRGNRAIFDKKLGYQVFNGTDLEMVMDKLVDAKIEEQVRPIARKKKKLENGNDE